MFFLILAFLGNCFSASKPAEDKPDETLGNSSRPSSTADLAEQKQEELINSFRNVMRTVPSPGSICDKESVHINEHAITTNKQKD